MARVWVDVDRLPEPTAWVPWRPDDDAAGAPARAGAPRAPQPQHAGTDGHRAPDAAVPAERAAGGAPGAPCRCPGCR